MAKPFQVPRRPAAGQPQNAAHALDILWGRPVFRAPPLANPRIIFDPLPFRNVLQLERRPGACRSLNAA